MQKLVVVCTLVATFALCACNTVEGAGQDVSSVGKTVAKTANDAKN